MRRFEIDSFIRFDWENMSNELLTAQLIHLAQRPGEVVAMKETKREILRRMTIGEGWAYFETADQPAEQTTEI